MKTFTLIIIAAALGLASCSSPRLPMFSTQKWHVDSYSGHAVNTAGQELAFGCEWWIADTALIQTREQLAVYPKLEGFLAKNIAQFPEIEVDSILFFNPARGLLFVNYHPVKSLRPTAETYLYDESGSVYSEEYARLFGMRYRYVDESGWEDVPTKSVYTNIKFLPGKRQLILLHRLPSKKGNIAVFNFMVTKPGRGKWWEEYPRGTFTTVDLKNPEGLYSISHFIHSSGNLAVENMKVLQ